MQNKIKKITKRVVIIFLPILIIASILFVIVNRGFYFSDFKDSFVVEVLTSDNSLQEEFIQNFQRRDDLAKVDVNKLYFQNSDLGEISLEAELNDRENLEYNIYTEIANNREVLINNAILTIFILVFAVLSVFYLYSAESKKFNLKEYLNVFSPFFIASLTYLITSIGLLSIISRLRYIQEWDFLPIILSQIIFTVLFVISFRKIERDEALTFEIFSARLYRSLRLYLVQILIISILTVLTFSVAFGAGVFFISLIFIFSILLFSTIIFWVSTIRIGYPKFRVRVKELKVKRVVSREKGEGSIKDTSVKESAKKKKKPSKKKKNKKKKS